MVLKVVSVTGRKKRSSEKTAAFFFLVVWVVRRKRTGQSESFLVSSHLEFFEVCCFFLLQSNTKQLEGWWDLNAGLRCYIFRATCTLRHAYLRKWCLLLMCVFSVAIRTTEGEKKRFSPFLNWFLFSPLIALLTTQCKLCSSAGVPLYIFFLNHLYFINRRNAS